MCNDDDDDDDDLTSEPRYNDNVCSQRRCNQNEFAVVQNI